MNSPLYHRWGLSPYMWGSVPVHVTVPRVFGDRPPCFMGTVPVAQA